MSPADQSNTQRHRGVGPPIKGQSADNPSGRLNLPLVGILSIYTTGGMSLDAVE